MGVNLVPIVRNFSIERRTFVPGDHDLLDTCISEGSHRLLRFDFLSSNIGDVDLHVGKPQDHPEWFVFSGAHGHYHFVGFNTYALLDFDGATIVPGFKQAFCLEDVEKNDPNAQAAKFTCADQGISAGWADLYSAVLPCQFISIDNVPDGDYLLRATTNAEHKLAEDNYSDNTVTVALRLAGDTVQQIPLPTGGNLLGEPTEY